MLRRPANAENSSQASRHGKKLQKGDKAPKSTFQQYKLVFQVGGAIISLLLVWYIADLFGFLRLPLSDVEISQPVWGTWKPNL